MNPRALRVKRSNARRQRKAARDRRANEPSTSEPSPRGWSAARKRRKALALWRQSRLVKHGEARLKYVAERWSVKALEHADD